MGDAQGLVNDSIAADCIISLSISSSASLATNGGRLGDCLAGLLSPVLILCLMMSQKPRSVVFRESVTMIQVAFYGGMPRPRPYRVK